MTATKHFHDIAFTVVAVAHAHYVEYTVYDITAHDQAPDGSWSVPNWPHKDATTGGDVVNDLAEAAVYLHGTVKWDGCSNWHFDEQDRVMLHGCTRTDLTRIGEVMARCWDWTAELCPSWSGE